MADQSFALRLITELEEASANLESCRGFGPHVAAAHDRLEKARNDLLQALTVPVVEEDFPTVLDMAANAALSGLLTANVDVNTDNMPDINPDDAARKAYNYASAMMAERAKRGA